MYKDDFLNLLLDERVLLFGEFVTKSGRTSPYFFNTGKIRSGRSLQHTAACYAAALQEFYPDIEIHNLFGPAYKGIPLACAVAMVLATKSRHTSVTFTYNRKEAKDHGEGGTLVGDNYKDGIGKNVLIVEDVLTAGTSLRESISLLRPHPIKLIGAIVGIDRQERGTGSESAKKELEQQAGLPICSLLSLDEIIDRLHGRRVRDRIWIDDALYQRIAEYRQQHS